ncbi:MAG: hypothetical protein WBK55_00390 [Alphaproteobacteria bacterium]
MQNTSTQSPDYASLLIPGRDNQPIAEQARVLLASTRVALKKNRVIIEEFSKDYFEQRLSPKFNRNATVSTLRAQRPKFMSAARRAYYDFKIVTQELETPVKPDIEDAVITIIANEALTKPVAAPAPTLQRVKTETKEPQKRADTSPRKTAVRARKKAQPEDVPLVLDKQTLLYQRAEKILDSTLDPIQQKRVQALGKIPDGFEGRLSKIFYSDPSVAGLRAKSPEKIPDIMEKFHNFKMAVEVLNYQHISDDIQHAVLSIIINRMIEKPRTPALEIIKEETSRPSGKPQAPPRMTAAEEREGLNLIRQMLQEIGKEIRRESQLKATKLQEARPGLQEISATAFTGQVYAKTLRRAEMIISFVRKARAEKRVKSFRTREDYDSPLYDSCNSNADLVTMRAQRPSASIDLEREFRLIVITASRLKPPIATSEPVRQAMISLLVDEAKDKAVRRREKLQDHARKIGRSATSRAAASETLSAMRNDPVKAVEHNKRASERIKKLYDDPEDKSGFRENRAASFSQQQRDSNGHFIKAEEPVLIPK